MFKNTSWTALRRTISSQNAINCRTLCIHLNFFPLVIVVVVVDLYASNDTLKPLRKALGVGPIHQFPLASPALPLFLYYETTTGSETRQPIFIKLEMYNYLLDTTPHANFRGIHRRGWCAQIANFTNKSYRPLLVSSPRSQVASLDAPHAQYVIMRRSGP